MNESIHLSVELFLFCVSIYFLIQTLFPTPGSNTTSNQISIVLVLVILQFLWEVKGIRDNINNYFNIHHSILRNPSTSMHLVPSAKEKRMGFTNLTVQVKKGENIFTSDKINRYIQTTPLTIILSNKKKEKIRDYVEKYREILLQYLNYYFFSSIKNHQLFINENKFCMSNDISTNSHNVICHTGGYYDSFLTNQISGTTLLLMDKKHTTINTEALFPSIKDDENNICLTDIASSPMNNHVGASTIGFTKDNMFLIWIQGETNQFNNGLLIPTGSGSVNASDMSDNSFQKTIIRAMERELQEETLVDRHPQHPYKTMLLGFYRWVSRGGKPEFVGITKLPEDSHHYRPNEEEVQTTKKRTYAFSLPDINDLPKTIDEIKKTGSLSVPLSLCLMQLTYMYSHHKEELNDFLFGNSNG